MTKSNFPKWLTAVFCAGIILCSFISLDLPAIIMFSVLCIAVPSPLIAALPVISLLISVIYGYSTGSIPQAISLGISSLSYVLPSVLIAISYFLKYSKFVTVLNGAFGIFIYNIITIITDFLLRYGLFSRELLNSSVDGLISDTAKLILSQISDFDPNAEIIRAFVQNMQQAMYLMKPLLPAMMIMLSFFTAYLSVCSANAILKALRIIEKKAISCCLRGSSVSYSLFVFFSTPLSDRFPSSRS